MANEVTKLPTGDDEAIDAINGSPDTDLGDAAGLSLEDLTDEDSVQAELFPLGSLEGEDTITPQRMIKKGLPVEVTASIGKAEVPLKSGMLDPNKRGRVLVSYRFHKNEDIALVEEGTIKGWKIRQNLKATFVEDAADETKLIKNEFASLMALDSAAAGRLLDDLRALFTQE